MQVSIKEIPQCEEEEILIKCHTIDDNVLRILHQVKSSQTTILGTCDNTIHRLQYNDIYYFETVDNKSFLYDKETVYETKLKLYEFEEMCTGSPFFRASKSIIINSDKIAFVRPVFSGRFEANLENGEKIIVSRQFVPELKKRLGM